MFLMTRGLPVLLELGLLVYCLIECVQTPPGEVRNLAKGWWIVLIVLFPIVGGISWLIAGRPLGPRNTVAWPSGRTTGFPGYERPRRSTAPDDDPVFLAGLHNIEDEQSRTLAQWEADLKRREEDLRHKGGPAGPKGGPKDPPQDPRPDDEPPQGWVQT